MFKDNAAAWRLYTVATRWGLLEHRERVVGAPRNCQYILKTKVSIIFIVIYYKE